MPSSTDKKRISTRALGLGVAAMGAAAGVATTAGVAAASLGNRTVYVPKACHAPNYAKEGPTLNGGESVSNYAKAGYRCNPSNPIGGWARVWTSSYGGGIFASNVASNGYAATSGPDYITAGTGVHFWGKERSRAYNAYSHNFSAVAHYN